MMTLLKLSRLLISNVVSSMTFEISYSSVSRISSCHAMSMSPEAIEFDVVSDAANKNIIKSLSYMSSES